MKKTNPKSSLEIWSARYIMIADPELRDEEDKEAVIIQIEHATGDDYLVEVLRPEEGAGHGNN